MAETSGSIDPFAALNFILEVDGMRAGFAEVEGLANETDIIDYREGNDDITVGKLLRIRKLTNVILRRDFTDSKDLWDWHKKAVEGQPQRLHGAITLLDESAASPPSSESSWKLGLANGPEQRSTTRKAPSLSTRWSLWWRQTFQLR
jgi:phage tail-like protein